MELGFPGLLVHHRAGRTVLGNGRVVGWVPVLVQPLDLEVIPAGRGIILELVVGRVGVHDAPVSLEFELATVGLARFR
jgi:hypothetical protein